MATKTLYMLDARRGATTFTDLQDGGSPPAAATTTTGWTLAKNAANNYSEYASLVENTSWTTTVLPNQGPNNSVGNAMVAGPFTGSFANANWTFTFATRAGNNATGTGRCRIRLYRGTNVNGSGATEITAGAQDCSILASRSTTVNSTSTLTYNPGALTLSNEYIFIVIAFQITTAGTNNGADVLFRSVDTTVLTSDWSTGPTNAYDDALARFKLSVAAFRDLATRFRLATAGFRDSQARLRLRVAGFRDSAARFTLQLPSTPGTRDALARLRLLVGAYRDLSARLRLQVSGWQDARARLRLAAPAFRDLSARFVLQATGVALRDLAARTRLSVAAFRDTASRLRLAGLTIRDAAARFALSAAGSAAFRDTASRLGLRTRTLVSLPTGDVLVRGSWTRDDGATVGLSQAIDELSADDNDYIQSGLGTTNDVLIQPLQPLTDPGPNAGLELSWRHRKDAAGGDTVTLIVTLRAGSSNIASATATNISETIAAATLTLTPAEVDAFRAAGGFENPSFKVEKMEVV